MRLTRQRDRHPEPLEWGSSFVDTDAVATRSRRRRQRDLTYDVRAMAFPPPGDQGEPRAARRERPIGARSLDAPLPDALAVPPEAPRRGGGRRLLSVLLLLAALAIVGGLGWLAFSFAEPRGGASVAPGQKVRVVIPQGADANTIANLLAEQGVVRNETVFRAKLKLNGDGGEFRSGTYTMLTGSSYDTVVRTLEKGPPAAPTFDVTLREGLRMEETAKLIDDLRAERGAEGAPPLPAFTGDEYLAAVRAAQPPAGYAPPQGPNRMEGFLFPATYELRHTAMAEDLVEKQLEAFTENMAAIDMSRAKKANLTPYDIVIIASLVEREARLPKERPLVSAVIWNRLKIGEVLGIDASNQYSVYEEGSDEFWKSGLTESDLALDSPYNLRKVAGLPPTPIANPGRSSLEAAANPADVDFRYYVANPDGSGEHFFTDSYDEFLSHPFQQG